MADLELVFAALHIKKVPCHVDTTPGNFILSEGEIRIIDWEYSGNNDPLWDLACLSMEARIQFTSNNVIMFQSYFGNWDEVILTDSRSINLWLSILLVDGVWCKSATRFCDSPEILKKMEHDRFANCLKILNSDEYIHAYDFLDRQASEQNTVVTKI